MRILAVCLGNICRSPTAEAAIREALVEAGLDDRVEVASAGTGSWHVGSPPDPRMTAASAEVALELAGEARQVTRSDLERADLVLAMDRSNLRDLMALAGDDSTLRDKVRLFRDFEEGADSPDVPDPYYGGGDGFAEVVAMARRGADGVVAEVRRRIGP